MSTTTALAAHDHTLGDNPDLLNCMCVLAIARGDDTPFDVYSLQGEDIVELCVKVGQAHPECVLWLLGTESVAAFQSSKEMLAWAYLVSKAMAWHDEPFKLHTCPPSTTHLWAYIDGRNTCSSGTQSPTPEGEEVSWSPPSDPHPDGRALCQFHMDLGDAQ